MPAEAGWKAADDSKAGDQPVRLKHPHSPLATRRRPPRLWAIDPPVETLEVVDSHPCPTVNPWHAWGGPRRALLPSGILVVLIPPPPPQLIEPPHAPPAVPSKKRNRSVGIEKEEGARCEVQGARCLFWLVVQIYIFWTQDQTHLTSEPDPGRFDHLCSISRPPIIVNNTNK